MRRLDILSINILRPQLPFVSLSPFFLKSNKRQGCVSKTERRGAEHVCHLWCTIISTSRLRNDLLTQLDY